MKPGRPEVATDLPLIGTGFTLQNIEVLKSVSPADRGEKVKVDYIRSFIVFLC